MDAHLFRLFTRNSLHSLEGSRVEKIQEPVPGLLMFVLHGQGQKKHFYFRHGKKDGFCFLSDEKFSANAPPSSAIMRLRRYFGQRRIAAASVDFSRRRLWLLASGQDENLKKSVWLCLDLVQGAALHFLEPGHAPEIEEAVWPEPSQLAEALSAWKEWPVLTPPLRHTLAVLDPPDQWALIEDLRSGNGNLYLYASEDNHIVSASAWPLPKELLKNSKELEFEDITSGLAKAGLELVLAKCAVKVESALLAPAQKRIRQLHKILEKLNQDESRLKAMLAREADALALKASLWRWPADLHAEKLSVPMETESQENGTREITLDRKFTIRENMERMFHHVHRGRRGLAMVEERRKTLLGELASLESSGFIEKTASKNNEATKGTAGQFAALRSLLPKNVGAFLSSDGYIILRGKDAKGNNAMRKLASPHDLWAHVENGTGAHVIIRRPHPGHEIPERTLAEAGSLAASKSWLQDAASASIEYAELRHIKPMRKGPPGMVTIDKILFTRIVAVNPELEGKLSA